MSDTLDKLQWMLVEQLGISATEIDRDSPLQDIGMDSADLEQFRLLIEENYNINMSMMAEEHYDIEIEISEKSVKDITLRHLAGWVDGWISCADIHP
jgi:acyl carrier protein